MSIIIEYADVAVGADKASTVTATLTYPPSALARVPFGVDEDPMPTCEHNLWGLDGTFMPLDTQEIGYWSTVLSGADGTFEENPVVTVTLNDKFTCMGIWLKFKPSTEDWANKVNISWFSDLAQKMTKDFEPNSTEYFCSQPVELFNKIVITFIKTSKPHRRIRIDQIIFGLSRRFEAERLKNATVLQEINPVSAQLSISTLNWEVYDLENINFMFQFKQPVQVLNDDRLLGIFFITASKRTSKQDYSITCEDAVGVLDDVPFTGAMYNQQNAKALILSLIQPDFPLVMIDGTSTVTGYIPTGTVRSAIQQICFAIGAVCSTAGTNGLTIFKIDQTNVKPILPDRIYESGTVDRSAAPTKIVLYSHTYTQTADSKAGDDVIKIGEGAAAKYYLHTSKANVWNFEVPQSAKPNVVEVKEATLVDDSKAAGILQILRAYYERVSTHNFKFVLENEQIGDYVETTTIFDTKVQGVLEKTQLTLSGLISADSIVRY